MGRNERLHHRRAGLFPAGGFVRRDGIGSAGDVIRSIRQRRFSRFRAGRQPGSQTVAGGGDGGQYGDWLGDLTGGGNHRAGTA